MRSSSTHPGWACFLLAYGSGIFTLATIVGSVQWALMRLHGGYVVTTCMIAFTLFVMGARRAEKLWPYEVPALTGKDGK